MNRRRSSKITALTVTIKQKSKEPYLNPTLRSGRKSLMPLQESVEAEKRIRVVESFDELDRIDREEDWAKTPQQRLEIVEEMRRAYWGEDYDAEHNISRTVRVVQF